LSYPKPDHAQEYSALFPRAECTFDQPHCALIFDREMLGKPVKKTADILATYLRQAALNIVISDYNHQSWTAKTRRVLRGQMANIQSLDDVAKQFDMHAKTLRRLLKSEGVRYSELKSQLRRDVAIGRLTGTNESIEQIAFAVGFSESCTFIRAFKAWTGVTPSAYRKLGRANLT
jgi:AraC-like DNA-binding protein